MIRKLTLITLCGFRAGTMRATIGGLLAAALMVVCGVASANVTYLVDISGCCGEMVTGLITTDGNAGPLMATDFLSWELFASGAVTNAVIGPPSAQCDIAGCGVAAMGDLLEYVGPDPQFLALLNSTPCDTNGANYQVIFGPGGVDVEGEHNFCGNGANGISTPPYEVGRSSAPEPPTALLLGIGVLCLVVAGNRARGRQSAAV